MLNSASRSDVVEIRATYARGMMWVVCPLLLASAGLVLAHNKPDEHTKPGHSDHQYVVLLKRGPKWIPNKPVTEQPLLEHGRYLDDQMSKGIVQLAGPFLDDSGGLVLLNAKDEADAHAVTEHDPGVLAQILQVEAIRPFRIAFDAATGQSPFRSVK
jgi:uncharacterized protein YciI